MALRDLDRLDLNILLPAEGTYFFPEDVLDVVITTPGSNAPVTGALRMADGTELTVDLDDTTGAHIWRATAPL